MNKKWLYFIYILIFALVIGIELFVILHFKKTWWILGWTLIGIVVVAGIIYLIIVIRRREEKPEAEDQKIKVKTENLKKMAERIVIRQMDDMLMGTTDITPKTIGQEGAEKTTVGVIMGRSYNFPSTQYFVMINMNDAEKFAIATDAVEYSRMVAKKFSNITQSFAENPEKEEMLEYIPVETPTGTRTMMRRTFKTKAEIKKEQEKKEEEEKEAI